MIIHVAFEKKDKLEAVRQLAYDSLLDVVVDLDDPTEIVGEGSDGIAATLLFSSVQDILNDEALND